jgi:hypothetical protein
LLVLAFVSTARGAALAGEATANAATASSGPAIPHTFADFRLGPNIGWLSLYVERGGEAAAGWFCPIHTAGRTQSL